MLILNGHELHSDWENSSAYRLLFKVLCCVCLRLPGFRRVQLESLHLLTTRPHWTFANVLGKSIYRSARKPVSWTRKAYSTTYEPDSNFADDNMTSITRKANSRFSKQETLSIDIEIRKDANLDWSKLLNFWQILGSWGVERCNKAFASSWIT
jgi:hypothetical protein